MATTNGSSAKLVFLALGFVVGAFTGGGIMWVVGVSERHATAPAATSVADAVPKNGDARLSEDTLARSERTGAARTEAVSPPTPSAELFGEVQRAWGRAEIARGWARERADTIGEEEMTVGLAQYEKVVREAPVGIGAELARRRTKAEDALRDAESGGLLTLLEKLKDGGAGPLNDLARDAKRFDALFPRQTMETFADGPSARPRPDKQLENGMTLTFPAGVFKLRGLMQDRNPFPSDVTIAGAGMDATLLLLEGALDSRGQLVRFGIRDCTVRVQSSYLVDFRYKPASLILDRARIIGFDLGAGASVAFGAVQNGLALRATDCRFEGGYGRHPQYGCLFDVRNDALIARFDRCRFELMSLEVGRWSEGATVVFSGCRMIDLLDHKLVTEQAATKPGVFFEGCSYTYFGGDRNQVPKKDLNALFPGWEERAQ